MLGASASIDGGTVVLGAPRWDFYEYQGAAYVFVQPSDGWQNTASTARLKASDGQAYDYFGSSVAISGTDVIVGAPFDSVGENPTQGAAYIFVEPAGGWHTTSQFAVKVLSSDGGKYDNFGFSVALEAGAAVIGSPGHNVGQNYSQGAAYVFIPE